MNGQKPACVECTASILAQVLPITDGTEGVVKSEEGYCSPSLAK